MRVHVGAIARRYHRVEGRPRTAAVVVEGTEVPVDGPELALVVDGRVWTDADLEPADVHAGPDHARLAWTLRGPTFTATVTVEADPTAGVIRKRAEVGGRGRLERVELDRWTGFPVDGFPATGEPVAYNAGPPGLGQPVFGPGFFAGIEHPAAENLVGPAGGCTFALPVAVELSEEPFVTPAVVIGAGGLGAFWDYLDTRRARPARLVTLSNNWYHLGATGLMDEAAVAAEARGFAEVAARHGLGLDHVCLDDGWEGEWEEDTGLWGRMAPSRFPSGPPAVGAGGPAPPGLGLWLSPFGGYGGRRDERVAWAAAHGLEVEAAAGALCPAGSRYRAQLLASLTAWTEAGVGYWKLDGVRFVCDEPSHGHPVGPGARTAQVDAFLALVDAVRAVRPDVTVAFTIGSWPSPWWLASVDFVWRGGLDDTAADQPGSRLDRFDTYIDACLHAYRRSSLPVSAVVTFSVVESAAASYRDAEGGSNAWERHCWLAVGRGTLHQDLYVAPDSLSGPEWAALARALAWARGHEGVLARSRMVLGDPAAGEVYGFAARRGDAATVCLRNPSERAATVHVDWAQLAGFAPGEDLHVQIRYGPDDGASAGAGGVTLGPFAVVVVEASTAAPA